MSLEDDIKLIERFTENLIEALTCDEAKAEGADLSERQQNLVRIYCRGYLKPHRSLIVPGSMH